MRDLESTSYPAHDSAHTVRLMKPLICEKTPRLQAHGGVRYFWKTLAWLCWTWSLGTAIAGDFGPYPWRYQLLPDSSLLDDCPICDHLSRPEPMRGSFDLKLESEDPLFSTYRLENIHFTTVSGSGRTYHVTGTGRYRVGGEIALIQDLSMEVDISDGTVTEHCLLTNTTALAKRYWPVFDATSVQENGTATRMYHLRLAAAPFRELWFSTGSGLTSGLWKEPTNHVSEGDLLSSAGNRLKFNQDLVARLGIMPVVPDLGLAAMTILPGGEIAFSIRQDMFSETLGPLTAGDLLSDQGRILRSNAELINAFQPSDSSVNVGLDAVQVLADGEIYFSCRKSFFSKKLGRSVGHGDVLSDRGEVIRSNFDLLSRFQPNDPKTDFGLDAFYVWPSGEIWFSTTTSFQNAQSEIFGHGDFLSEQGYRVGRNLELLLPFQPIEDLADFGIEGLFVVSDATALAPAPQWGPVAPTPTLTDVIFDFAAKGRAFQIESASTPVGPWQPASVILPGPTSFHPSTPSPAGYFRILQW